MLTDERMRDVLKNTNHMVRNSMYGAFWPELEQACRAIESAATEPLLQRIAELECLLTEKHNARAMWQSKAAELERQLHEQAVSLEEARNQALEEAAVECDKRAHAGDAGALMAARAIRALKGAKE